MEVIEIAKVGWCRNGCSQLREETLGHGLATGMEVVYD